MPQRMRSPGSRYGQQEKKGPQHGIRGMESHLTTRFQKWRKIYRFSSDEVYVQQLGDAVLLIPKESLRQTFLDGLNSFTDDIFEDGRQQGNPEEREAL